MAVDELEIRGDRQFAKMGVVTSIGGSKVRIKIQPDNGPQVARVTSGSFVIIYCDDVRLIASVANLNGEAADGSNETSNRVTADLELIGQIHVDQSGAETFRRGVAVYPAVGDLVEAANSDLLRLVYQTSEDNRAEIGTLYHESSAPACVRVKDLISKHFAILGNTGVGKSSGAAVLIDSILQSGTGLRIFLLDVHNEYAGCFGTRANVVDPFNLKLPFWLFNLEEFADVIFAGRPPVDEELEILGETIALAKNKYAQYKETADRGSAKRSSSRLHSIDTPVPYLIQDLISIIDERMGRLDNRSSRMHHHRLITRIETIRNDPRYSFMFDKANVGGDIMGEFLAHIFRLEPGGQPITIMQLAGLPPEMMDAFVCVLCRLAFEFGIWSDGAIPLLFVCEEAHRYASADRTGGFTPTRRAISRIAREGRKYGVYLGLITQRPSELDATILSQCSTIFAMRMSNERDQEILKAAIFESDELLSFVPLLGTGEVIVFGEGVPIAARLTFRSLPGETLPQSRTLGRRFAAAEPESNTALIGQAIERWRSATMSRGANISELTPTPNSPDHGNDGSSRIALDRAHGRLLRRPPEPEAEGLSKAKFEPRAASGLWRTP